MWVFGVADYESEVSFAKFKMADPRWRTKSEIIDCGSKEVCAHTYMYGFLCVSRQIN